MIKQQLNLYGATKIFLNTECVFYELGSYKHLKLDSTSISYYINKLKETESYLQYVNYMRDEKLKRILG